MKMAGQLSTREGGRVVKRNRVRSAVVTSHPVWALLAFSLLTVRSAQGAAPIGFPTDQIIVRFRDGQSDPVTPAARIRLGQSRVARLASESGLALSYHRALSLENTHVIKLPARLDPHAVARLAQLLEGNPEVEHAEVDRVVRPLLVPNDTDFADQWDMGPASSFGINVQGAWDLTQGRADQYIAVLDTGILPHPDLQGRYTGGYNFISSSTTAGDGDGRDSDPTDPGDWTSDGDCGAGIAGAPSSWHGTHVTGTVAALGNNGLGVAGVNWKSMVVPIRVLGKCGGTTSDLIDAIQWAAGLPISGVPDNPHPAKVMNLSLGADGACDSFTQAAVNRAIAAGSILVVAAGNSGDDLGVTPHSPAACDGVIAVAATGPTGEMASYTNYGAAITLSAPGGNGAGTGGILSTYNAGTSSAGAYEYAYLEGTSMATPHVAGVVSLMVALNPDLTATDAIRILRGTAAPFATGTSHDCTTSVCGAGQLDAQAAVSAAAVGLAAVIASPAGDTGGGCIGNAVAGDGKATRRPADRAGALVSFGLGVSWLVMVYGLIHGLRFRRRRREAWLAWEESAHAGVADSGTPGGPNQGVALGDPCRRAGAPSRGGAQAFGNLPPGANPPAGSGWLFTGICGRSPRGGLAQCGPGTPDLHLRAFEQLYGAG